MSYLNHNQPLPYSEQQEREGRRAAWEDAHLLPPLQTSHPPGDNIDWWLGQAVEALDSYRNCHGQVEAVGRLYRCCVELAKLARGRDRPSDEELQDEAAAVMQVRNDVELPSLSFTFDDLT